MRTFYIASALFVLFIAYLLQKPIPKQQQVARSFSASEIDYLEKSFDYAMDSLKEGEFLDWSAAAVNGRISVGNAYESRKGATCRQYVEVARTHDAQKVTGGIACKRQGKDGWCRIQDQHAPQSCALEVMESSVAKQSRYAILRGSQMLDQAWSKVTGVDVKGMLPNAPHIKAPGMPDVTAPDVSMPDFEPGDFRPPMPWDPQK